jgi:hypothetical protein
MATHHGVAPPRVACTLPPSSPTPSQMAMNKRGREVSAIGNGVSVDTVTATRKRNKKCKGLSARDLEASDSEIEEDDAVAEISVILRTTRLHRVKAVRCLTDLAALGSCSHEPGGDEAVHPDT